MRSLAIILPIYPAEIIMNNPPPLARSLSPDPKEAVTITTGFQLVMDFGKDVTLDTAFIGYHSFPSNGVWNLSACDIGGQITQSVTGNQPWTPLGMGPPYHSFFMADQPVTSRYFRLDAATDPAIIWTIGVVAFGLAWRAEWGHEWGAGRTIEDTGSSERLFGGGWAIDDGVAAGGYQWTFGDLQPDELQQLYRIVKDRRTTRSLLVVEDPDQTDGLNERLHWGLFRKLDAYERLDPLNTKWSLQIGDWA